MTGYGDELTPRVSPALSASEGELAVQAAMSGFPAAIAAPGQSGRCVRPGREGTV
jgi:hypothetical protein